MRRQESDQEEFLDRVRVSKVRVKVRVSWVRVRVRDRVRAVNDRYAM